MVAITTNQLNLEQPHWVGATPIQNFARHTSLIISQVMGDTELVARVQSMGLIPGQQVKMLRKTGASIVLKIENARIALRLSQDIQIFAEYSAL